MKLTLVKTTVVVAALVGATVATVSAHAPTAAAAGGPAWPIDTYGTPRTSDNVVLKWDEQLLSTIRAYPPQTGPTVTARALAEVHTAMYDAWAAYDQTAVGATPGAPVLPANGSASDRAQAMSFAAYRVLTDLFPAGAFPAKGAFARPEALMGSLGYDPANTGEDLATPAGVGNAAAAAVIAYRHADGSNQVGGYADTTGYTSKNQWNVVNDKWSWQPLCVLTAAGVAAKATPFPTDCSAPNYGIQKPLTPQWDTIKTFGPEDPTTEYPPQFALPGPNADGTHAQATADIDKELADSSNLSDVQKMMAEYWADGPNSEFPPGHMALFAAAMSRMKGDTADQDVKLFFALGNALFDASIFAWTAKFQFDSERPTTGIRERYRDKMITSWLGAGKGYGKVLGQYWQPYQAATVVTPAFPEYVSGHSTFSAAGRSVINQFFGTDNFNAKVTIPAGSSKFDPGVPAKPVVLSWKTFDAMADQAGMSRRYGGIHFQTGDEQGRTLGALAGYNVWLKAKTYFAGTA
ncbi:MAG: DUF6851 domain-containing protein [Catenulispora sp.]